ncbi:MAG TPA: peptide ABC transporter substrate-binding protein [Gammaproteobacteria bacterium]|nr:peptide ABC transporter substrate-binding protein [Gammaproteobacteria bacterium]
MQPDAKALIFLLLAMLAGCGSDGQIETSRSASSDGIVLNRGNGGEPDTLDPHRNEEDSGAEVLRDLFEGLTTETVDADIVPGTAASWTISDDGLVYTFSLRPEARWSNGDPVVAEDFVAGLRRTVDPATASTYAQILYPIENAEAVVTGRLPPTALGVRAIDDRTLEIRLAAPTPYFLALLSHGTTYPIHRASLAEHGANFARPGNLVSNGAYRLTEWLVQSHIKLVRNEHYWDAHKVQIDTVYFHATENIDAELRRYRAGELDMTFQFPSSQYDWIQANLPGELRNEPYISTYFYVFDVTEPPFDDIRLRQALSMAIDRRVIAADVAGSGQPPAFGIVPDGVANYIGARYAWAALPDAARIAEARRLYAAAGYSADRPLRTEIRYNTSENHQRIAIAVASMWRQTLGVEARPVNEEWKVMLQTRLDHSAWEVMRLGWVGDYNDAFTFLEIFGSTHGQNFAGFADPEYDTMLTRIAQESDPVARRDLMHSAEKRVLDAYPIMPLYFYTNKHVVKPYVKGFRANIMNHNYSRHLRIERN